MSTIVQKWASIPSDTYFKSDCDFATKSEKDSLCTIFDRTIERIRNQPINDTESIIKAAENVNVRYLKAYNSSNILYKIYFLISGLFGFSLIGSYNQLIDKLALAAANRYQENLRDLRTRFIQVRSPFEEEFLKKVIDVVSKNIESRKENHGLIYQITNSKGVNCYLIGTCHLQNNLFAENKEMKQIVEKSSELITELGDDQAGKWLEFIRWIFSFLNFQKILDCELVDIAHRKGIKVNGLESWSQQQVKLLSTKVAVAKEIKASSNPDQVEQEYSRKSIVNSLEFIQAWQNGDENAMFNVTERESPEFVKIMINDRNEDWLRGVPLLNNVVLTEKLRNADAPICIAVGALHCVGPNGLAQAFRSSGLTVTRFSHA